MTKGRRVYCKEDGVTFTRFEPGDYGKDGDGLWYCRPPGMPDESMGCLSAHDVVEHEDGTITVSPSILITTMGQTYHGFLAKGEWHP